MSLLPIDKSVDDLISRKARESGKSKAEILRMLVDRGNVPGGEEGEQWISPQDLAKAVNSIPDSKPGSLASEMKEMASTFMTMKMMQMMGEKPAPAAAPQHDGMADIQRIFMLKELTKPSIYELMMIQKLDRGEEVSPAMKELVEGEKETRKLLEAMLGEKQETQRQGELDKVIGAMTSSQAAMKENYDKILEYLSAGGSKPDNTIEGYIANALKEQLTERALDAIDKGFFNRQEVVNPEGGFNWKGVLDRMMNIGEEFVKKMPTRTPAPTLVRRMDGNYVDPRTGQVVSAADAAAMGATGGGPQVVMQQAQPPIMAGPPPPGGAPPEPEPQNPEQHKEVVKKKTADLLNTFETQDGREPESTEPSGTEEY